MAFVGSWVDQGEAGLSGQGSNAAESGADGADAAKCKAGQGCQADYAIEAGYGIASMLAETAQGFMVAMSGLNQPLPDALFEYHLHGFIVANIPSDIGLNPGITGYGMQRETIPAVDDKMLE